jgi:hypothetical protein
MIGKVGAWGTGAMAGSAVAGALAGGGPGWALATGRTEMSGPISADVATQSSGPLSSLTYRRPTDALAGSTAAGAAGVNADWEQGKTKQWFIEEQRAGEVAAIGGIVTFDQHLVEGAVRLFDWGFARQGADGGFAGTGDPFHSTSFFVAAVAHTGLFVRDAASTGHFPLAEQYLQRIERYTPLVQRAAHWMARPDVWSKGLALNAPYTHRRYLVGAALGLTGVLADDSVLVDRVSAVIEDGLARQRADGVNPELGGSDSSYQMTGVVFAQYWVSYLPNHPLTPRVRAMLDRALAWEASRVSPGGAVSAQGNTRTAGQEKSRAGVVKSVAYSRVIRGFAGWGALTGDPRWTELAWRTGRYYYGNPVLAGRPLLP